MRIYDALMILGLTLSVGTASGQAPPDTSVNESLRMGTDAIRSGNVAEAERHFSAALKAAPDNPEALMGLGVAEMRLGKPDLAADLLQRATTHNPVPGGAYLFLGIAYAQMHRVDECIAVLKHEVELDPKDAQAYMWMGVVELQDGHPEKATEPLDRAAELVPNDLNILEYRGKAHNDVAFASYARMAVIDPDSWHVHRVQGQIYSRQSQHKEAIAEFLEAIKKMPNNSDLYEELGGEYRKSSQLELAQQAYSKELELSPNNPVAMYNLAKIDIETNRSEDGLQLLEKVVATYKNFPATYFYLGLGEFDLGKTKDALDALEKARPMHPEPELAPRVEYELSRVYRKLGRIDDSNHAIREYTRLKAQNARLNPEVLSAISSGFGSASVPTTDTKGKN
ncbi:MAG TPA: tetratricopeptide repeat protein [Terracidiphilus sp.]|jgi:tetratricopeptide (TPR) repeat protein